MEGHEGELEADTADHEGKGYNEHEAHGTLGYGDADAVEVERAHKAIDKAETHKENSGGEHGCEDIFHSCLMALIAMLVEGHHGCKGERGGLKTNDEEKEVAA